MADITVKNVTKVYGKKKNTFSALDDVTLSITSGESIAIVGKSGSGKSTLMHIMSGLDRATSGTVVVNGHDIAKLKNKALDAFRAKNIGFIFQAFFVQGNETCAHNVSLPLEIARIGRATRKARVADALKAVGMEEKAGQQAKNLSGGQKQRLAIARVIAARPAIIFADEPTGNLDSATGEKVEKLLFDLNKEKGTTLVVVTHDADLAAKCDRQVVIKDGKIVSDSKGGRI